MPRVVFRFRNVLGMFLAATMAGHAFAEDVSSDQILKSLTTPVGKTRSLSSKKSNADSAAFLKGLPSRGLRIDERKKVGEIIDAQNLPKIDLDILFDFNSAKLRPEATHAVEQLGNALNSDALKYARVALNGHTDATGSDADNQLLSERRAEAVRDYLIASYALDPSRLVAIGYGEERLKAPADPQAGDNRRVEVVKLTD